jgi:two-component system, chemotaxis family, protein-glutamate methylesterase/glutaminase
MEEKQVTITPKLIVIGGSTGSLEVVMNILPHLRPDFNIPILIVLHRMTQQDSSLADLLSSKSGMPVKEVEEKEPVSSGYIYLAPADYHVLIEKEKTFSLDFSEKVEYSRPSIDVTFKSASDVYGNELVCIVLSGANSDGADGAAYAKSKGGFIVAEDPMEAAVDYMPRQAIRRKSVDLVLTTSEIIECLNLLQKI